MKILLNRAPVNGPWGGGNNFVSAFFTYAQEFDVTIGTRLNQMYDAILVIDPRLDELGVSFDHITSYKTMHPQIPVFQRINECDARKGVKDDIDPVLRKCSTQIDHTFWVSNWIKVYHRTHGWGCAGENIIYNGVDRSIYRPTQKLNNGKVNIVTHHWSDNPFKGQDVHAWLDDFVGKHPNQFTYTYIGRHQTEFKNARLIEPLWGQALGDELGKYDVYVTGTVCDPGPNHVIEALAAGLPTYAHKRGGGAIELAGQDHTFTGPEELETLLMSKSFSPNMAFKPKDWVTCVGEYINAIKKVTGHDRANP